MPTSLSTASTPLTLPISDAAPRALSIARITVGCAVFLKAAITIPEFVALAEPAAIRLPLAAWLPVLPAAAMIPLTGIWIVAGLAFASGRRTRLSGGLLSLVLLSVLIGDQQLYSNHLYLLWTVVTLLTLVEGGASWAVPLLLLQVSIVYGFAAASKLNSTYLSGAVLQFFIGRYSLLSLPEAVRSYSVMAGLAWLSICTEAFLATFIWSTKLRPLVLAVGVLFHVAIVLFLGSPLDLVVFALVMFALYALHAGRDPGRTEAVRAGRLEESSPSS